jgi:serine-type D-Ala-D-Ala carboxypeptidase (penicillin-binding protein 5/6)
VVVSLRFRVPVLLAVSVAALASGLVVAPVSVSASVSVSSVSSVTSPPSVDVASYVIVDYDTGQILAEQNPHHTLYPASTLKVLTADTLIPRLNANREVTPQAGDFAAEPDGSVVGMTAGITYSIADLWRAMFVESANDAVAELAHLSGGLSATVAAMRQEARSLGAHDTTVVDADGYDQDGQLTSAYDLALFARAGLRLSAFRSYCDLKQTTFPGPKGTTLTLESHDPMLLGYPGMIGIKGGLTTKAGHTYVGAATRNGHTIIETLMLGGTDVFDQAAKLMDWAFAADGKVTPVGTLGGGAGSGSKLSAAPSPTPSPSSSSSPSSPSPTPTAGPTTLSLAEGGSGMGPTISIANIAGSVSSPPSPSMVVLPPLIVVVVTHSRGRGSSAMPWSDAAWIGAGAAAAAVAVPVGVGAQGMYRRRRR